MNALDFVVQPTFSHEIDTDNLARAKITRHVAFIGHLE